MKTDTLKSDFSPTLTHTNQQSRSSTLQRLKGGMFQWRLLLLMHWFHSVMVLKAMIRAFRKKKNQQTIPSWHLPPQVLPVLIMRKSQFDVLSYKTSLESVKARLVIYQQNETVFEEDIKLLKLDVMLRDNALVDLRKKFKKAEQERDELKLKLDKFQTSSKNLSQLLASQTSNKTGLGYDNQVFNSTVFNCDEMFSSELDVNNESESEPMPTQKAPSFVQTSEHVKTPRPSVKPVEHPILDDNLRKDILKSRGHRHIWNRKACFVCKSLTQLIKDYDYYEKKMVQNPVRNHAMRGYHQHYARMSHPHPHRHVVPTIVLTRSRLVPLTTARPIITVVPHAKVQHQRPTKHGVTKAHSPKRRPINLRPSPTHNTECIVLYFDFKLSDDNHVLLRDPKENNMYNVDLKNIVPLGDLTCLFAKATLDESNNWHRRLGHINFKTMNKLVKGNLVRGLPSKVFKNNHTCVACKKGKQHRASCKSKPVSSVSQPLQRLHMDLFRPTFVKSRNKKSYCLVVTDDYSRFSWVFFLTTKDETSTILNTYITGIENQLNLKVKIIRSDNGTEFKNQDLNQLCGMKGIKREFSVARTPQQNRIAERKNKTLIEAARTMLADLLLPIPFWTEAVNTAYPLGKFDGKADEGFLVGYSISSKAFRVFNDPQNTDADTTFEVKEPESAIHVSLSSCEKTTKQDYKTKSEAKAKSPVDTPVLAIQPNSTNSTNTFSAAGPSNTANTDDDDAIGGKKPEFEGRKPESKVHVSPSSKFEDFFDDNINKVNAADSPVPVIGEILTNSTNTFSDVGLLNIVVSLTHGKYSHMDSSQYPDHPNMLELEDITYSDDEEDVCAEADFTNLETTITYSKPEDPNELFQNLLEDLKELAEYDNSPKQEIPPQDSDIRKLIREECCVEVFEEQKQSMEDTMLELVKIFRQKEFLCIHDNVEDLIESDLNSKLLSINSNSQRLDNKKEEVKNVVEQPAERRNRIEKSLQNLRVIRKSSISLKNSSQISSIHAVAPILSIKEPEYSPSMGYENSNTTLEKESDEIMKSGVEELVPILSENEVTLEDKREFYDDLEDVEYVEASLSYPEIVSVEEENKRREVATPLLMPMTLFPSMIRFALRLSPIRPDQERLINVLKNDIFDDSSNDPLLEEADLFLASDNSIPPGIENVVDDSEGDIRFIEELLIDDSILSHESSDSNFEDNPSVPRPPPEPPYAEFDAGEEISVVMNDKDEDVDYSSFIFVIFVKLFSFLSAESEDTILDPGISV
nr:putative ribonuclease H-like domain-containing protein [Tanacetum cinerariifolium]